MFLVLFLYFLYALTFVVVKAVLVYAQPIFFVGLRMVIGGGLLLLYMIRAKTSWRVVREDWFDFAQIAFFNIFIAYICEFWSMQFITASKTSLIFNLTPFATAALAHMVIHERLTLRQWVGLGLGFFGLFPILMSQNSSEQHLAHMGFFSSAELVLLFGVIAAAYSWIIFKKLVVNKQYTPIHINALTMIAGGIPSLIVSFFVEPWPYFQVPQGSNYLNTLMIIAGYMTLLIFVVNIFIYNLYGYLLKKYTATFLALVGFVTPLFTALMGWFFLGEEVGMWFYISMIIITTGLILFYIDEKD